jgi:hypothetical protein
MKVRLLTAVLLWAIAAPHGAIASGPSEYEVKAAFLYNFAHFVEWPLDAFANPTDPLRLCVLGNDPFGPDLDRVVEDKTVNDHPLVVERIQRVDDAQGCHIAFVTASEPFGLTDMLAALERSNVLTVGEASEFLEHGGMIAFRIRDNKVRFAVNVEAAAQARIKISSKLLKLADLVVGQPKDTGARQ